MSYFSLGFDIGFMQQISGGIFGGFFNGFGCQNFCMPNFFSNPFIFNPISLYMVPPINSGMFSSPEPYNFSQMYTPDFSIFTQNIPNMAYNFNTQCTFGDFYTPSVKTDKSNKPKEKAIEKTSDTKHLSQSPAPKGNANIPANERKYDALISKYAQQYGVEENFVRAVMKQESRFNPKAESGAGAKGLMQLMPATARQYNVTDPFDPEQSIRGGVHLLSNLSKMYKGDKKMILAAYNWGCGNLNKFGFEKRPAETRNYVNLVLKYYEEYNVA